MAVLTTLDDSSISLQYQGNWTVFSDSNLVNDTAHSTTAAGASVSLKFNGTYVEVIGALLSKRSSSQETLDPLVDFQLDESNPSRASLTGGVQDKFHVSLFKSALLKSKEHTLTVTNVKAGGRLLLDAFTLDGTIAGSNSIIPSSGTPTQSSPAALIPSLTPSLAAGSAEATSQEVPVGQIVGGVIGGISAVILFSVIIMTLCTRRRRDRVRKGELKGFEEIEKGEGEDKYFVQERSATNLLVPPLAKFKPLFCPDTYISRSPRHSLSNSTMKRNRDTISTFGNQPVTFHNSSIHKFEEVATADYPHSLTYAY